MPRVNPDILKWARETAGLTRQTAEKLDILEAHGLSRSERLVRLEAGEDVPYQSRACQDGEAGPVTPCSCFTCRSHHAKAIAARISALCRPVNLAPPKPCWTR